jgi:hypothetical protein
MKILEDVLIGFAVFSGAVLVGMVVGVWLA